MNDMNIPKPNEPKSFYPRNEPVATVGEILRHINCCAHGTRCCFYCHKKFPYGREKTHVHGCWLQWKMSRERQLTE